MKTKSFLTVAFIILFAHSSFAQISNNANDDVSAQDTVLGESEIMRMFESLGDLPFFAERYLEYDSAEMNPYGYEFGEVPIFTEDVYQQRIEQLASQTTLPMVYNPAVRAKIDNYVFRFRAFTGRMLGLSYVYFPMFEEMLDKYNMPLELKCLAVVESALNPLAVSRVGAKGLWQFMYATGKQYGLKSNSLVDDRFDPMKETEAACRFMLDLYSRYKDWFLVLAAYNSGPGTVNKAIARAGGVMDYWAICPYLPVETQNYVPTFIAINYVIHYAKEHNLYPLAPDMLISGTDTVTVRDVLTFAQLNEALGVTIKDLETYNPQYTKGIIPASDTIFYVLRLPSQYAVQFAAREKEIYAYKTREQIDKEKVLEEAKKAVVVAPPKAKTRYHTVKKGETLSGIAKKYKVSVNNIKKWNNLKSNTIRTNQRLRVSSK
jgi:membrane-bound lytic murein transglycosylase D